MVDTREIPKENNNNYLGIFFEKLGSTITSPLLLL